MDFKFTSREAKKLIKKSFQRPSIDKKYIFQMSIEDRIYYKRYILMEMFWSSEDRLSKVI